MAVVAALELLALVSKASSGTLDGMAGIEALKEEARRIVGALREPQQERLLFALDDIPLFLQFLMDAIPAGVGEGPAPVEQTT